MVMTGKQKAAMLLMSLDADTAAELLKGIDKSLVQELAVELAYIDATGNRDEQQSFELTKRFCEELKSNKKQISGFLNDMLINTVGQEQAQQIQVQIEDLVQNKDPFISIRSTSSKILAASLESEHPQAVATVLSELPPKKSSEVLSLLSDGVRLSAISRMTNNASISEEAKKRIAEMVCQKIETLSEDQQDQNADTDADPSHRRTAVILRNLSKEIRDGLLNEIRQEDPAVADSVIKLMVIWQDISLIENRSMQAILREIDSQKLALALVKADPDIEEKIKDNISERAKANLEEEASLMSKPKKEEIENARLEIVETLRKFNEKGELQFIEEE